MAVFFKQNLSDWRANLLNNAPFQPWGFYHCKKLKIMRLWTRRYRNGRCEKSGNEKISRGKDFIECFPQIKIICPHECRFLERKWIAIYPLKGAN
jgi:hypothetical protein